MNKIKPLDLNIPKRLGVLLGTVKEKGNLKGVMLSSHDGNPISENIDANFNGSIFSAMCASVIESAEDLRKSLGESTIKKIITEQDNQTIMMIRCDKNSFLILIIGLDSKVEYLLNDIDNIMQQITEIYPP